MYGLSLSPSRTERNRESSAELILDLKALLLLSRFVRLTVNFTWKLGGRVFLPSFLWAMAEFPTKSQRRWDLGYAGLLKPLMKTFESFLVLLTKLAAVLATISKIKPRPATQDSSGVPGYSAGPVSHGQNVQLTRPIHDTFIRITWHTRMLLLRRWLKVAYLKSKF